MSLPFVSRVSLMMSNTVRTDLRSVSRVLKVSDPDGRPCFCEETLISVSSAGRHAGLFLPQSLFLSNIFSDIIYVCTDALLFKMTVHAFVEIKPDVGINQ